MRGSHTTQPGTSASVARSAPEPGLVAVFLQSAPASLVLPLVGGELVLGRSLLNARDVEDSRISREHVHVSCGPEGWRFSDLASRNGTFVDGVRLNEPCLAPAPRVLRVGDTLLLPVADVRPFAMHPIDTAGGIVRGPLLREVFEQISSAAHSSAILHVQGETGSGKELAARWFHDRGRRARGQFVAVNCAAIPPPIAERLFFGVRRGTYTGADADAEGFLQAADGGTLFLDEIAELDLAVQAKLLRTLESGEVLALGAAKPRKIGVAVVSATSGELEACVAKKTFRGDLYFRLGRPTVRMPPLRDRLDEIPWLVAQVARAAGTSARVHASFVEAALCRAWPGNVRELLMETRAALRRATEQRSETVRAAHFGPGAGALFETGRAATTAEGQAEHDETDDDERRRRTEIVDALRRERGNVAAAARRLGLHRTQLRRLLVRYQIDPRSNGR